MKKSLVVLTVVSTSVLLCSCATTSETYDSGYNDYTVAVGVGNYNSNYWGANSYYYPANPYYRSWTGAGGYYGYVGGNRGYLYRGYGGRGGSFSHSGFHGGGGGFHRGFSGHGGRR